MNRRLINRILAILLIIVFNSYCYSEYIPTDSLLIQLKNETNLKKRGELFNEIAGNYLYVNPDSAKAYLNKALDIAEKINDDKIKTRTYCGFAFYYAQNGDYLSSGNYLTSARKIAEPKNDYENLTRIYASIATNYDLISLTSKSREYFLKCYEITKRNGKDYNSAICLVGIASSYLREHRYATAEEYLNKTSGLIAKYFYTPLAYNYYMAKADVSKGNNDISEARTFLDSAKTIAFATNNFYGKVDCYIELSYLYNFEKKYSLALNYALKANELSKTNNYYLGLMNSCRSLSVAYESLCEYQLSNKFLWEYENLRDSAFNESVINKIQIIQSQYDFDLTQTEFQKKKIENNYQSNLISEREKWLVILVIMSIFGIILTYMLFKSYRNLKNYSYELNARNEEISKISETLEEQNVLLETTNATKDKFFQIIGHDLRNPIGGIRNLSDLLLNSDYNLTEHDRNEIVNSIYKASNTSYELLENLLQWAKAQTGGLTFHTEPIDLNKLVKRNCELIKHTCLNKRISIIYNESDIKCLADFNLLDTILRNLLSNAVKFTNESGRIQIEVNSFKNEIENPYAEICISDTGVGMNNAQIEGLFKPGSVQVTKGTNNESGSGLGLILCKEFLELMGGSIWVESEEGKGSKFYFTIPLAT